MDSRTKLALAIVVLLLIWYSLYKYNQYQECVAYWQQVMGQYAPVWIRQYC